MIGNLLLTLLIGGAGAWVFHRTKIPAGAMVGGILFVGAFQIFTGWAYFPEIFKTAVQAVAGGFVGQRIRREDVREIRSIVKPAIQLFVGVAGLSTVMGLLIRAVSSINIATAMLSSVPGGVSDVALISAEVGADPAQCTVLQLVRYLVAMLILPQVDMYLCRKYAPEALPGQQVSQGEKQSRSTAATLGLVALAGVAGRLSHIPAGAMVLPMFAVAAYNVGTGRAYLPPPMKLGAQCLAGVTIGVTLSLSDILQFRELLLPALLVALNCLLVNYLLGFWIYKTNDLDLPTSLFATVPAGLSEIALVSLEEGADAPKVAVLQLVRYLCVIAFMPTVIRLFALCL